MEGVLNSKIKNILSLAETAPVLVVGLPASVFGSSTIIDASIPSKELGIVNTVKGLKTPKWLYGILRGDSSHQIIISGIDSIDKYSQEKFYELLNYRTVSSIEIPKDCKIIVTANSLKGVSETILRLCLKG